MIKNNMINFKKQYSIELAETLGQQHWYKVNNKYFPSSTTILQAYPFSQQLIKWIAEQGYDESQKIKSDAGTRGVNTHHGIELLLAGNTLEKMNFSIDEWSRLCAFTDWYKAYSPEVIATEVALYSKKYGYAGRADVICLINGKLCLGDWKTSASISDSFALQVSSYAHAFEEMTTSKIEETFILQLGSKNKNNYRYIDFTEWRKHFTIFLNVKKTWEYDTGYSDKKKEPPVLHLPLKLCLSATDISTNSDGATLTKKKIVEKRKRNKTKKTHLMTTASVSNVMPTMENIANTVLP